MALEWQVRGSRQPASAARATGGSITNQVLTSASDPSRTLALRAGLGASCGMRKHQGSCLCGEVRFQVVGDFDHFFLCHCSRCRKDTGSAHAANLFSVSAKIEWLCGESSIRTFQVPSTRHVKAFCSICGSAAPTVQMDGTLLAVPAGSLDSPMDARPDAHICVGCRAEWDHSLEQVPQIDELPG